MPNALTVLASTTSVKVVDTSLQKYAQENYDPKSMKGVCIFQHNPFLDTVNVSNIHLPIFSFSNETLYLRE